MPAEAVAGSSHAKPQRSGAHGQGMQQYTHLTRLLGGAALPLTVVAQWAGAATVVTSRIDHAQAPSGFSAPLVDTQGLSGWTTQRAIWLRDKVAPREAASFPGQGFCDRSIALCGRWRGGLLL
jgi:hypothetical protein